VVVYDPWEDIDFHPNPGDWYKLGAAMRKARRHFSSPTAKRPTKWCRQFFNDSVQDETNLVIGDGLVLCPITTAIDSQEDITCETVKVVGSIRRISSFDADLKCMWIMAMQKFDASTGNALQVVNPFDEIALSSQDIMGFGFLPVPPVLQNGVDTFVVNQESIPFAFDVKAKRKLKRNTNTVMLTFASQAAAGADSRLSVDVATSMLMKFS